MAIAVNLSNIPDIDGVLNGWKWGVTDLTYAFPANSTDYTNFGYTSVTGFETFTAAQRLAAISILEGGAGGNSGNSIESFTNLTFTFQLGGIASLRFADATKVDYTDDSTVAGHTGDHALGNSGTAEANLPESGFGGAPPFFPSYAQGDAWFTAGAYNNPTLGSFQYTAGIMHEIGHNLGLKHGQQTQTSHGVTFSPLPANHNSQEYSVMTYAQYVGDTNLNASNIPEAPTTYMQDDIAALQYMYGANYGVSAHNTSTVYTWSQTTGEEFINGTGQGAPEGIIGTSGFFPNPTTSTPTSNWIFMTVWDGGGDNDFYNFSNFTTNMTIDLNPGAWTITDPAQLADLGNDGGAEQFAHGNIANALIDPNNPNETASLIENAIAGSGNDTMTGNSIANSLSGGSGNDTLDGGGGHDTLIGGPGNDNYDLNDVWVFNNGISIGLFYDDVIEGPNAGTDWVHVLAMNTFNNLYTLTDNVENGEITGTLDFDLTGNALDNVLMGNSGKNVLNGAGGTDTVDYSNATSGVTVSLTNGTATGGGGSDTLVSIENVTGSTHKDTIVGSSAANLFISNGGSDTMTGFGGADIYRDIAANLNGDTITDFITADIINVADAAGVVVNLSFSGHVLSFALATAPATPYFITLNGGTVAGTPQQAPDLIRGGVDITFPNAPPVNSVPGTQIVNEDTNLAIAGLAIADADAGAGTETSTLSVLHGTLTVASASGATVAGSGTGSVTLTGTVAQINTTLSAAGNVVYRGVQDYNGPDTLTVLTNDGGNTGTGGAKTDSDGVAITVNAINDAPVITSNGGGDTAAISIAENATAVATVLASDIDAGTTLAFSIIGGVDQAKLQINATTGALSFVTAPDFDAPADADHNNSYIVVVQASDGSLTDTQTITVNVSNVNEAPVISSNGGGDAAAVSMAENITAVTTVAAVDPDAGTTLGFSLAGGADQALFQINATSGALSFVKAPDFESPTDADHNNSYLVQVRVSDGALTDTQAITVNVSNAIDVVNTDDGFHGDLGGDHKSDLIIRDIVGGGVSIWQMNGGSIQSQQSIGAVGTDWHIESSADFGGDGKADVLWRNDDGSVALWQMNGAQIATNTGLGKVGTDWHIDGTGDFNGDGKADILWHSDTGAVAIWQMNGSQVALNQGIGTVGSNWHVVGTGDFNGDHNSDILWRADDGTIALWQMNGTQIAANINLGKVGLDWHVAGTGDFNGDGQADILFRNDNGTVATWQMNNSHIQSSQAVGTIGPEWKAYGTGDLDGDGKADILFRNDAGLVTAWQMNGTQIALQDSISQLAITSDLGVHHYDLV